MKKIGILFVVLGLLLACAMYFARESSKPVHVTTNLGTGYMNSDGWSEAKTMFNFFIGLGVVTAVAGTIILFTSWRTERESKKQTGLPKYSRPTVGWKCVCGAVNAQSTLTCACGKNKPGAVLSQRWRCNSCGSENPPAAKECVRCGSQKMNDE